MKQRIGKNKKKVTSRNLGEAQFWRFIGVPFNGLRCDRENSVKKNSMRWKKRPAQVPVADAVPAAGRKKHALEVCQQKSGVLEMPVQHSSTVSGDAFKSLVGQTRSTCPKMRQPG